jgi:small subunit ribosomal protein S16
MLSIRLSRTGKKNQPSYRLIVSEKTKDPWGTYLEILGFYNPRSEAKIVDLKEERLKYWISKGAQLSATVNNLLVTAGVVNAPKMKVQRRKKAKGSEEVKPAEAAKPEAPKTETPKAEVKPEASAEMVKPVAPDETPKA